MTGERSLQFGPITFVDFDAPGWAYSGLIDWFGSTPDKKDVVERPQQHGAFPAAVSLRASKAISFRASFRGETGADVEEAFDRLSAVAAEGPVLLTANYPGGSTWRKVTATVNVEDHFGLHIGEATIHCVARDPRRYRTGTPVITGPPSPGQGLVFPVKFPAVWPGGGSTGRVTLRNEGRAPSPVSLTLAGGFSSALITCVETGARVGLARPIPSGQTVVIENGRASINGQDISRWLRFREWTEVPGLLSRTFQLEASDPVGQPTLIGRVDHAWW
ncbi:hypothetical protein QE418_000584 [Microbacterium testaceum]|uniref:hypothetical protein n=1 Tax=Microbacterium TaxID=33882 RepID=UPI00278209D0|nr:MULTISPECIES: hypothetical protein [Microbacterium]MDQ1111136.1 hypothetical protein [Microbacterium testaceum]MDR6098325.1 hypothetical protein [Microbacterium sp. SORGH_AS_0454]